MFDVNSGIELLNQGKINQLMDSIEKVDPLLDTSLKTLESILIEENERRIEFEEKVSEGLSFEEDPYEFNPKDFKKTIKPVIEMLKNNASIPESATDPFDRVGYANAWIDFCDAVVMMAIGSDMVPEAENSDQAIRALSMLYINDDFVNEHLKPHGISVHRYDPNSPYVNISKELSLPYFTFTEGVFLHSSPVTTSRKELWWYNVLSEAHSRWEKILDIVHDATGGEPLINEE